MHLRVLSLVNFRNYESLSLVCNEQANLFLGSNGQGKTNLLEAIYYLCVARSCREARDKELIRIGGEFFQISGAGISRYGREIELDIQYGRNGRSIGKRARINQQELRTLSDLVGTMTAVMLCPDDRHLIQGPPQARRRFLDIAISQISAAYLATLRDYSRVVDQRNEALRSMHGRGGAAFDLDVWNAQLIQLGCRLMRKRQQVVKQLGDSATLLHREISESHEEFTIQYKPSFVCTEAQPLEDAFAQALAQSAQKERTHGVTVVGPHRDDLILSINGLLLKIYGSQGQQKTAATSMKLAEAQFLWEQVETPPLLLLDDMFAELDSSRTAHLIELLPTFGQVFVTAAKESDIGAYGHCFTRFYVEAGTVAAMA